MTLNAFQFRQNQSDISRLDCKTSHECLNASLERFTHDGERSFRCASIDIIADSDGSWIMHRSFTFTRTNCVLSICNLSATLQILPRNSVIELIRSENPSPITCDSHRIMKETWERSTSTPRCKNFYWRRMIREIKDKNLILLACAYSKFSIAAEGDAIGKPRSAVLDLQNCPRNPPDFLSCQRTDHDLSCGFINNRNAR